MIFRRFQKLLLLLTICYACEQTPVNNSTSPHGKKALNFEAQTAKLPAGKTIAQSIPGFIPSSQASTKFVAAEADFHVAKRSDHLEFYPCTDCHEARNSAKQASPHKNIAQTHPGPAFKSCATCHQQDSQHLESIGQKTVSFDSSYLICSQCHFQEFNDWKGGAHGKRLSSWSEKRIIANCTTCHNPHKPDFSEKRRPKI